MAQPTTSAKEARRCAAVLADLASAGAARRLKEAVGFYTEAAKPEAGCDPKALFCAGRGLALAHVDAAYAAAQDGKPNEASDLFEAGARFGEPWPVLVGTGDAAAAQARAAHDPKRWGDASLAYQKAVSALDEPPLCDNEPPRPEPQAYDEIVRKMSLATLLAQPVSFFHTKCAPCNLAFLSHGVIAADRPRVLPITFEDSSAHLTPEGIATTRALADCALGQKWSKITVSAHTDERGTAAVNMTLAQQRIESLRRLMQTDGYKGTLEAVAKGKSEPLRIDEPQGLSPNELQRANRRIELRGIIGEAPPLCTAP